VQEAAEMYTLISLVATGLGLSVVPASVTLHHAENVVIRELHDEEAQSEIAIAWNLNNVSMTTQLFLQLVFEGSKTTKKPKTKRP